MRKNKNKKNKLKILGRIVLAAVIIVILVKVVMVVNEYKPSQEVSVGLAVNLNLDGDFPNPKEGTAIFNNKLLMDRIILKYGKVPKYVIFTESNIIPGLVLRYNVHDSVFEGGIPLMRSKEVDYLDGNIHEIIYTFKEGAHQKFYFDGEEIASGDFDASKVGITGFVVNELDEYDIIDVPFDGSFEMLGEAR